MGTVQGVEITGPVDDRFAEILTEEAQSFLADLHREFDARRLELLEARKEREAELAAGGTLDFLPETRNIREDDWRVAAPAPGLVDRRVEITGPTDRKMTINALNSGAKVLARRPRGRQHAAVGERGRWPAQPARRHRRRTIDFTSRRARATR